MSYDAFMVFGAPSSSGITVVGESSDADPAFNGKALELYSFSIGASNPVTLGSQTGGGGAGKVSLSSFNIMKKYDSASPSLFRSCCDGGHFPTVTVTLRKAGGKQLKYLTYTFTTVFIESVQDSGTAGGDETPTESVSLAYGKVVISYQPQDSTGAAKGSPVPASWNAQSNAPD